MSDDFIFLTTAIIFLNLDSGLFSTLCMRRIQRAARFLLHADAATKPWAHTPRAQKWVQTHWPPEQRAPCDGTSELRACNARPSNQETPTHTHPNPN